MHKNRSRTNNRVYYCLIAPRLASNLAETNGFYTTFENGKGKRDRSKQQNANSFLE